MYSNAQLLARAYENREIIGWEEVRQPGIAKAAFDMLNAKGVFSRFTLDPRASAGKKMFLHWVMCKVFGCKTAVPDYYPQEIGDCVSFGAKHGTEITSGIEIFQNGEREKWRPVHPSYYYGTGRIYVGGGQLGNDDGSLGSWMAEAVMKYGTLFADEPGVPKYSGALAKSWGYRAANGIDKWKPTAQNFPIKAAALIRSWDELVAAINNGYACPTASDVGYNMEPSSDGFHRQTTNWGHQMCFIGVDDSYKNGEEPYALMLNNWGDCHGNLKDFETGDPIPPGILRIRRKDAEKHIRAGETFAYSNFQGFPEQKLDKALFMMI